MKFENIKQEIVNCINGDFYEETSELLDSYGIHWGYDRITLFNELEKAALTTDEAYKENRINWVSHYIENVMK